MPRCTNSLKLRHVESDQNKLSSLCFKYIPFMYNKACYVKIDFEIPCRLTHVNVELQPNVKCKS